MNPPNPTVPLRAALSVSALLLAGLSASAAVTTVFDAGNPSSGNNAYQIIHNALGSTSIESPDLGPQICHSGTPHIVEVADTTMTWAFRFTLHEGDCDPTGTTTNTRERVEIKAYDGSNNNLKGFQNQRMKYVWNFRIDRFHNIGPHFTHIFQLKSVGGNDSSHPLLTLTGANGDFEIRHSNNDNILARTAWSGMQGKWMRATVDATFSNSGSVTITIYDIAAARNVINITRSLDMFKDGSYIRPKWGLYRDNPEQNLGDASIRMANFAITKY